MWKSSGNWQGKKIKNSSCKVSATETLIWGTISVTNKKYSIKSQKILRRQKIRISISERTVSLKSSRNDSRTGGPQTLKQNTCVKVSNLVYPEVLRYASTVLFLRGIRWAQTDSSAEIEHTGDEQWLNPYCALQEFKQKASDNSDEITPLKNLPPCTQTLVPLNKVQFGKCN